MHELDSRELSIAGSTLIGSPASTTKTFQEGSGEMNYHGGEDDSEHSIDESSSDEEEAAKAGVDENKDNEIDADSDDSEEECIPSKSAALQTQSDLEVPERIGPNTNNPISTSKKVDNNSRRAATGPASETGVDTGRQQERSQNTGMPQPAEPEEDIE